MYNNIFDRYDQPDGVINRIGRLLSKDTINIVRDFIKTIKSLVIKNNSYSYLDAVIINKKIYKVLMGEQISSTDNLDTVTYLDKNNTQLVDSLFTLIEQYMNLDIYKQTGLTYTEYKSMTPIEKNILLDFLTYKREVENYDYEAALKEQEEKDSQRFINNEFDLFG